MGEQHANGWRVSRHRLVADATVGVIANPMSGRDIRRLVASASMFPNAEKASMVVRLTAAAGALGVGRVLVSTDTFGVSAAVLRESRRRAEAGDPRSKLRTSRHARATSSAVATAWWENWASRK
jgi:predicted polyphosphate/ATP-dependent NAD kinase